MWRLVNKTAILRNERKWSRTHLGNLIGTTGTKVRYLENARVITDVNINALAKAFGVPVNEILVFEIEDD